MKIEVGKVYRSKFRNAFTDDGGLVEVEKIYSDKFDGFVAKLKGFERTVPINFFDRLFEKV